METGSEWFAHNLNWPIISSPVPYFIAKAFTDNSATAYILLFGPGNRINTWNVQIMQAEGKILIMLYGNHNYLSFKCAESALPFPLASNICSFLCTRFY